MSFVILCVQIDQLFESQWIFKLSWCKQKPKQRFLPISNPFFNDWPDLQKFTNLDAKGVKRSVQKWATKFYTLKQWFYRFQTLFQQRTGPAKIDQSGHKRCQKKRTEVSYQVLYPKAVILPVSNIFSKTDWACKNWPIWTQKVSKEGYRREVPTSITFECNTYSWLTQ